MACVCPGSLRCTDEPDVAISTNDYHKDYRGIVSSSCHALSLKHGRHDGIAHCLQFGPGSVQVGKFPVVLELPSGNFESPERTHGGGLWVHVTCECF